MLSIERYLPNTRITQLEAIDFKTGVISAPSKMLDGRAITSEVVVCLRPFVACASASHCRIYVYCVGQDHMLRHSALLQYLDQQIYISQQGRKIQGLLQRPVEC